VNPEAAAVHRRQLEEARCGGAHRLVPDQRAVGRIVGREIRGVVERLDHSPIVSAQPVQSAVAGWSQGGWTAAR